MYVTNSNNNYFIKVNSTNSGILLEHDIQAQTSIAASMWVKLDKTVSSFPTVYVQLKTQNNSWDEGYLATTETIVPEIWQKLSFIYNNSTGVLSIYINNELKASKTLSGNIDLTYTPFFGLEDIDSLDYSIKELVVFDSSTIAEIEELDDMYFTVPDGVSSLWAFNEGTGIITYDAVDSYIGTLINCEWGELETLKIYPIIERVINVSSNSVLVRDASRFNIGDIVYLINSDTEEYESNTITAINTNIITLSSMVSSLDSNLLLINEYNIPVYTEFNTVISDYTFDLFNYYKVSDPEVFVAITSDTLLSVTLTPTNIQYKTSDFLTREVEDFTLFRLEIQDGGVLKPYYSPFNLNFSFYKPNNYYSLYLGEGSGLTAVHDTDFTSIKLEQWINIRSADNDDVYLFGQLETQDTSFEDSYLESETVLNLNEWYHIGLVYDETDGILKLFIDGELDCEQVLGGQIVNTKPVCLGIANTDSYTANYDELKVWSVGTTVTDVNNTLLGHETGLVYYYKFDEGEGTVISDTSYNSIDGNIIGDEYEWNISEVSLTNPYLSDTIYVKYINKMIRDRFIIKPKTIIFSEYKKLFDLVTTQIVPLDNYEEILDTLALYAYTIITYDELEILYVSNIKLYKCNHVSSDIIRLVIANIEDIDYRATLIQTDGTNIVSTVSKNNDKLLAFVFDTGNIYLYVPKYFKGTVNELSIYEE